MDTHFRKSNSYTAIMPTHNPGACNPAKRQVHSTAKDGEFAIDEEHLYSSSELSIASTSNSKNGSWQRLLHFDEKRNKNIGVKQPISKKLWFRVLASLLILTILAVLLVITCIGLFENVID
jgi:hypothetical protein